MVNVNLLTTLEVSRMEYLIQNGGVFSNAKKQAQQEILNIFSIHKPDLAESELLDISQNGDDNAILFAISLILQGYRTEAELTQLLGDIATDIRTDGVLNSPSTGTLLINDARLLDLPAIRANIEAKYLALGASVTIPDFEHYINVFIDSTGYVFTKYIQYPFIINAKENLLKDTTYTLGSGPFSVGAYLPSGTRIKVVVKSTPGFNAQYYGWGVSENSGWTFNNFYPDSAVLTATGSGQTVDIPFVFGPPSSLDFIIYENNSVAPTRIKTIPY
jgi:hypothetical protein